MRGERFIPEFGGEFFGFYRRELANGYVMRCLQDVNEDGEANIRFVKVAMELSGCLFEDIGVLRGCDLDEQALDLR